MEYTSDQQLLERHLLQKLNKATKATYGDETIHVSLRNLTFTDQKPDMQI